MSWKKWYDAFSNDSHKLKEEAERKAAEDAMWKRALEDLGQRIQRQQQLQTFQGSLISSLGLGYRAFPPPPPLPKEKRSEALVGWRNWVLDYTTPIKLRSLTADCVWDGPVLRSGGKPSEAVPFINAWVSNPNPSFGIYAYKQGVDALYNSNERIVNGSVAGRVLLSGTVIEHTRGYRSEVVTIDRLYIPPIWMIHLQDLEKRYQCEVSTDWRHFLREEA